MGTDGADLTDGRYLRFALVPARAGRSTPVVNVICKRDGHREAVIKWRGRRGFSLWPEPGAVFGPVCLGDVCRVIDGLNRAHREGSA